MTALCWNCRGLGNPRTVCALIHLIKEKSQSLVFLSETKLLSSQMEGFKRKLGFKYGIFVDRIGLAGGLALLWREDIDVILQSFSSNHIDVHVDNSSVLPLWRFTGFYGEPNASHRTNSWALLRTLSNHSSLPWLCGGDFNKILHNKEKSGSNTRTVSLINNFQNALSDCNLFDLGYSGHPFTWFKSMNDTVFLKERLDRFVGSLSWSDLIPNYTVSNLTTSISDHSPICIT